MTCGNLFKCIQCGACYEFIVFRNRKKKRNMLQIYFTIIHDEMKLIIHLKTIQKECIGTWFDG